MSTQVQSTSQSSADPSSQVLPPGPWSADKVAANIPALQAPNGVHYAAWGEVRVPQPELERLVGAVPGALAPALGKRYYYFVPLIMVEGDHSIAAPNYSVELGDRAVCHRNVSLGSIEAVFISTRLVEDRFGLAFEFFINVAHNFVDAVGVPESFADLTWSQAQSGVRGETSQDAWEARRRAVEPITSSDGKPAPPDERARKNYEESAFSDTLAIYMLSLALDFDYHDLREREYPLLAAPALAERLRHVASLFPANDGYEFQILYRRKG
ncbi:hypothetical protein ACFPT7_14790 [Acidicapsa dinghuensis]|uniref:Uncharacterized protein n=1 Tax=Acidicapsa dinghuensis TaxID=2218256 RepID=A0ABW1EH01_9BACT|nr:hypothetical protein [Acidicapsa dinghuensis]